MHIKPVWERARLTPFSQHVTFTVHFCANSLVVTPINIKVMEQIKLEVL